MIPPEEVPAGTWTASVPGLRSMLTFSCALALIGLFGQCLWNQFDNRIRVTESYTRWQDAGRPGVCVDPWARQFLPTSWGGAYSVGPNGVDENGGGDDVYPLLTLTHGPTTTFLVYRWWRFAMLLLATVVAWACMVTSQWITPWSGRVWKEAIRAILTGFPPVGVIGLIVIRFGPSFVSHYPNPPGTQLIEPPLAVVGSGGLVTSLAVLYLRSLKSPTRRRSSRAHR